MLESCFSFLSVLVLLLVLFVFETWYVSVAKA